MFWVSCIPALHTFLYTDQRLSYYVYRMFIVCLSHAVVQVPPLYA